MPEQTIRASHRSISLAQAVDLFASRVDPQAHPPCPFIGLEHIEPGKMRLRGIGSSDVMKGSVYRFSAGDVLYGRMRPNLAKVFQTDFEGVCSTEIFVLRTTSSLAQDLLPYILMSRSFTLFASEAAAGDRPRLRFADLGKFEVALPDLKEQLRIVSTLRQGWRDLIAAQDLLADLPSAVAAYRAEVVASAFRGQLTPGWRERYPNVESADIWAAQIAATRSGQGEEARRTTALPRPQNFDRIGTSRNADLPSHWCQRRLGDLFEIKIGATPNRRNTTYWNGGIPWVSSGEIHFNRIKTTREGITDAGLAGSSARLLSPGTVLVAMIGEGSTRGRAAILDIAAANSQNSAAILVGPSGVPPEYVFYFLESNYQRTRELGAGNSQRALNKSKVAAISIPVAPAPEMREIVDEIEKRLGPLADVLQRITLAEEEAAELGGSLVENALAGRMGVVSDKLVELTANAAPEVFKAERQAPQSLDRRQRVTRGEKMSPTSSQASAHGAKRGQQSLGALLSKNGGELTPEELFKLWAYDVEEVETFFLALRAELQAGTITESRPDSSRIVLRHGSTQ